MKEALAGFTICGAEASFRESEVCALIIKHHLINLQIGQIKPGFLADFVVFSENFVTDSSRLLSSLVTATVIQGDTVFGDLRT